MGPTLFAFARTACLVVLIALSALRRHLRLSYAAWQATQALLAVLIMVFAVVPVILVEYHVSRLWERVVRIIWTVAFVALGLWVRLIQAPVHHRHRWAVEPVTPEAGDATSIVLRELNPTAYGRYGCHFEAGQFAWILARKSPSALTFHPFSFSPSAQRTETISFTVEARAGFFRKVADLVPGELVYVDGPFGAFTLPPDEPGADRGRGRCDPAAQHGQDCGRPWPTAESNGRAPLWLGNLPNGTITCADRLQTVRDCIKPEIVPVLSRESPSWQGRRGRIDPAFVSDHLPDVPPGPRFMVCGPEQLTSDVESALVDAGVPAGRINAEPFGSV